MQVNQWIWRGTYNQKDLRWDIRYNAVAGCEILIRYLKKALSIKTVSGKPLSRDLLA
ncbi:MAG: hypothetical protein JRD04_04450, partial [Deltaproteobacteria bacterium]|nr:hypothetical protein [Deltaproteobacteria bacterium]